MGKKWGKSTAHKMWIYLGLCSDCEILEFYFEKPGSHIMKMWVCIWSPYQFCLGSEREVKRGTDMGVWALYIVHNLQRPVVELSCIERVHSKVLNWYYVRTRRSVILSSCHPAICQHAIMPSGHLVITQSGHYVLCCHYCLILINPPSACIVFKSKVSSALNISHLATNKYQEGNQNSPAPAWVLFIK